MNRAALLLGCACGPTLSTHPRLAGRRALRGDAMRAGLISALFVVACASDRALLSGAEEETSTSASSSGSSNGPVTDDSSSGAADTSSSTTTFAGSSSSVGDDAAGCPFVCASDIGASGSCDLWAQDCPLGQKCTPWANDAGFSWNDTRCVPIADDPAQPGEPCTVASIYLDGIDDCELGAMCWNVEPVSMMGTCVAFCEGSEAAPSCVDPATQCTIANEGVLILCLPLCNPLAQDCGEGEACYPIPDGFTCTPDAPGGAEYGGACEFVNVCDPGQFCDETFGVPGCMGTQGCCNAFCDLAAEDPNADCPDAAQGQTCIPWFEPGEAPPGFATLGRCALP